MNDLFLKISNELHNIDVYAKSIMEENYNCESEELLHQIAFCTKVIRESITEIQLAVSQPIKTYDEIAEEWYQEMRIAEQAGSPVKPLSKHLEEYIQVFNVWKRKNLTQSI